MKTNNIIITKQSWDKFINNVGERSEIYDAADDRDNKKWLETYIRGIEVALYDLIDCIDIDDQNYKKKLINDVNSISEKIYKTIDENDF